MHDFASRQHGHRAATKNQDVTFVTLGSLRVWNGGRDCTPKTPKVLQVLALLLMRANRAVQTESLINELWGDEPPRSALTTIQTYVYQLRRLIEREGLGDGADGNMLITQSPGYILRLRPGQVDLDSFAELRRTGRAHFMRRNFAEASANLRAALALWTENALANVKLGPQLTAHVVDLQEQRRTALQMAIEAELELGMHRELVGELRSTVAQYPLDEWFHQRLMQVLDRCGRRSDALGVYHHLRRTIGDELGIDPSPEIQELHRQLLE